MTPNERMLVYGGRLGEALQPAFMAAYRRTLPRAGDGGYRLSLVHEDDATVVFRDCSDGGQVRFDREARSL